MSSSISFSASAASKQSSTSIYSRPQKKQKMSITQTYFLAHSARGKLSKEASRSDHDLRLLVGHANLLDSLMIDLASAEQEQESWFNKSVSGAKASDEETPSHEWAETVIEEPEVDWEAEDADSTDEESQYDEDEDEDTKMVSSTVITATEIDQDDQEEDDEGLYGELALTRTPSRHTPPELSADSDSDSEDEHMPPSPPQPTFDSFTEKERQAIATTSFYDKKEAALTATEQETFVQEGFYFPSRQQPTMIAAY